MLRQPLGPVTTPGESGDRIVIRSNFNTHIAAVSERHIAPPKTSETMAETHGMLDTAAGPPDKTLYTMLVNHDGSFPVDPAHPDQPVPFTGPQLTIPYLPDPFAPGAAFATLPGRACGFSLCRCPSPAPGPIPSRSASFWTKAAERRNSARIRTSACCGCSCPKPNK